MTPALQMRASSRGHWERKAWQAEWTEAREVWSRACTHTSDSYYLKERVCYRYNARTHAPTFQTGWFLVS